MPVKKSSIVGLSPPPLKSDRDANIMELASRIGKLGNDVTVFVSDAYQPLECKATPDDGFRVKYLNTEFKTIFPPAYLPFTPELADEIGNGRFDVIQSAEFFQWGTILASRAASENGVPFLVWQEMDINPQFPGGILQATYNLTYGRFVSKRVTSFVPRSTSAKKYLLDLNIRTEDISPVIHTGVDTRAFYPLEDPGLKDKLGFPPDAPLILSVGRLHPNKGFDILIRTIAQVKRRIHDISLIVKGDGPQKEELEDLVNGLHLERNVKIVTEHFSKKEMNELYGASDFTAIASRVDLFPFSAIESLACGKPVVSIFGRAVELDVIGNHGTGIYIPDQSMEGLADAIVYLVRNPQIRREMGRKAHRLCQIEFDLNIVSQRFHDLYAKFTHMGCSA